MIRLTLLLALLLAPLYSEVTDSIVPQIERLRRLDFDRKKLSDKQYARIQSLLPKFSKSLRVMSYNMLFTRYEKQFPEVHRWPTRKARVAALLAHTKADLVCVQELFQEQVADLLDAVGEQYDFIGYRAADGYSFHERTKADPSVDSQELNGFFYSKERLELVDSRVWWLSRTPEKPSSSPFSSSHRTLTLAHFRDRMSNQEFQVANVHVAFGSIQSRSFEFELIAELLREERKLPLLLAGDFNSFPMRVDLEALPFMDGDYNLRLLEETVGLRDSYQLSQLGHVGPLSTYTSGSPEDTEPFKGTGEPGVILDHILVDDQVYVLWHAIEPARVDGHFPSDHMPVLIEVSL